MKPTPTGITQDPSAPKHTSPPDLIRGSTATPPKAHPIRAFWSNGPALLSLGALFWAASVVVGRERTMDVLASGTRDASRAQGAGSAESEAAGEMGTAGELDAILEHLRRRYESILVNAPARRGAELHQVVGEAMILLLCVRTARTSTAVLRDLVGEIARRGAVLRGLVIWERPDPVAIAPRPP